MLKRTLIFLCLLNTLSLFGQELTYVQGNVIVQFKPQVKNTDIAPFLKRLATYKGRNTLLKQEKCLSEVMNVFLLKFDYTQIHERRFLRVLQKSSFVQLAQLNHIIKYRKTPNDPNFIQQWQYINDGSLGGQLDADLDADKAWDITTGGVTPNGDTIVLAALDDGVDFNHIDLKDNLWKNHGEIPDNGIDDDENGYIDDYHGWNILTNNDQIESGIHGTPVMGIMGAKGDNALGVTGVNWNVKLMMIQNEFQSDEANVLAGYGYPLAMRKLYNETNGAKGAFVVATNSSWGLDEGMADEAPIWCSLYDSLGAVGILNCGATANANLNVDVEGDLPTTCPSDYLIGITNVNRRGEKERQAAYGIKHIDIGAFGEDAYTVARNGLYGAFGGTSGATPHVTGAIGLLYAAPCENFSNLSKNHPATAALLARKYILEGAKANPNLDTLTATGGQLNLYNSLQLLMQECGPCPPPLALSFDDIIDISTTVNWILADDVATASIRYRVTGTTNWTEIKNITAPYLLTGLTACTDYEVQIKSDCTEEETTYNRIYTFKTDGCCIPPENVRVTNINTNTIRLEWDALFAAKSYEVHFNNMGAGNIQITQTDTNFIEFDNLLACTTYEFQVRTICENQTTDFSPLQFIRTNGCGSCTDMEYCAATGDGEFEWISKVSLNTLVNESGSNEGYGDFTGLSTDLNTLETYELTVNITYESFPFTENIQVWIDFNQDGVFNDSTENVVNLDEDITNELKANITIPIDAVPGLTRMRIAMKWREGPDPNKPGVCATYDFGEVEDYCVNIIQSAVPCLVPNNIHLLDDPIDQIAFLAWDAAFGANSYSYRYRIQGTETWETGSSSTPNSILLSDLTRCAIYEVQAQSLCDSMKMSDFSDSFIFNTACDCFAPDSLFVIDSTTNTLSLAWTAVASADNYEILFINETSNEQRKIIVDSNYIQLTSLDKCTNYDVQVRGFCLDTEGQYIQNTFQTECDVAINEVPSDVSKLAIFPNPLKDYFQLELVLNNKSSINLQIFDAAGKLVMTKLLDKQAIGTNNWTIPTSNLENGLFLLKIITKEGYAVRRVVKM